MTKNGGALLSSNQVAFQNPACRHVYERINVYLQLVQHIWEGDSSSVEVLFCRKPLAISVFSSSPSRFQGRLCATQHKRYGEGHWKSGCPMLPTAFGRRRRRLGGETRSRLKCSYSVFLSSAGFEGSFRVSKLEDGSTPLACSGGAESSTALVPNSFTRVGSTR